MHCAVRAKLQLEKGITPERPRMPETGPPSDREQDPPGEMTLSVSSQTGGEAGSLLPPPGSRMPRP